MGTILVKDGCMREIKPMNGEGFTPLEIESYLDGIPFTYVLNEKKALLVGALAKEKGKPVNNVATSWIREVDPSDYVCGPAILIDRKLIR